MPNVRSMVLWPAAILLVAGCTVDIHGQGQSVRTEEQFRVTGEPELTLETFDGSVRVRSWDRNEVIVEIEKKARTREAAEQLEVKTSQEGNRIHVEAPSRSRDRALFNWNDDTSVHFTVRVPRRLTLHVRTRDGSIVAEDLDGTIDLNSGDGSITADHVAGTVRLNTGDGSIRVNAASGRLAVNTGDGSVTADGRFDDVRVHTGDGSVRVDADEGSTIGSDWSVETGDGSVNLRLPSRINAEIDARSGDGRVSARGDVTTVRQSKDGNELRARVGRGGPTIRIHSGDGAIDLNVR